MSNVREATRPCRDSDAASRHERAGRPTDPSESGADAAYLRFPHLHGDLVCFAAEDDLWLAPVTEPGSGPGRAWRLTVDRTRIGHPRFSPDGSQIAFTTWRSYDPEIHLIPVAGGPERRLTYWGSVDARVCGWTPPDAEGRCDILAVSSHNQPFSHYSWAYRLRTDGSPGERLPWGPVSDIAVGRAAAGSLDPAGNPASGGGAGAPGTLLLTGRPPHEPATWKRYRGGAMGRLWLDGKRLLPDLYGHLDSPMFVGDRIVFLSDHEGTGNLYSCRPDGSDLRRHTDHDDFYARHASTDGRRVVYQCAGDLWLVDDLGREGRPRRLDVRLGGPRVGRRRYQVPAVDHVNSLSVDPTGRASAVCVRGSLYWLTHRDGPARALADTPGVRVRLPEILGDTGRVAYVTDAEGDDAIEIAYLPRATGAGEPRRLAAGRLGRVHELVSSPDGRQLAVASHDGRLLLVDVAPEAATAAGTVAEAGPEAGAEAGAEAGPGTVAEAGAEAGAAPTAGEAAGADSEGTDAGGSADPADSQGSAGTEAGDRAGEDQAATDGERTDGEQARDGQADGDTAEGAERGGDGGSADGPAPVTELDPVTELVRSTNGPVRDLAFSPDSGWLAWSHPGIGRSLRQIRIARLQDRTIVDVTDGRFEDEEPVFTRDGRYLAFLSWRGFDPVYDVHTSDLSFPLGCRPYLVPLSSATPSPFALSPEGRPAAGGLDPLPAGGAPQDGEGAVTVEVEGLASRVTVFPVAASKYSSLYPVSGGGLVWLRWPISGALGETFANPADTSGRPTLEHFDLAKAKRAELTSELDWFAVSGDGSRLVVDDEGDLRAVPATESPDGDSTVHIDMRRILHQADPAAEWRQAYDEAGRIIRAYFWAPDMCGVDWDGVLAQYRPLVERVASPDEFADLLREVLGELGTSHAYVRPSRTNEGPVAYRRPIGLLGADFTRTEEGAWVVARILPGESSDPRARSPLAGAGIQHGAALTHVDGRPVDPVAGPYPLLAAAGGTTVELTFRQPSGNQPVVPAAPAERPAPAEAEVPGEPVGTGEPAGTGEPVGTGEPPVAEAAEPAAGAGPAAVPAQAGPADAPAPGVGPAAVPVSVPAAASGPTSAEAGTVERSDGARPAAAEPAPRAEPGAGRDPRRPPLPAPRRGEPRPRRVAVVPLIDERPLRYQDWVARRREVVRELSGGRCGYLHIPDMGGSGWAQFNRDLRREVSLPALIVDVRGNAGGNISELVVEKLTRTIMGWDLTRHAEPVSYTSDAPRGPIVALADEMTSSDGDMITAAFRLQGIGPVVGLRTWGGVVGMTGRHRLGDGSSITVPMNAAWFDAYGWGVENHGVEPDIEVPCSPVDWAEDSHPQLGVAVATALDLLERHPAAAPPDYSKVPDRRRPPLPPRPTPEPTSAT